MNNLPTDTAENLPAELAENLAENLPAELAENLAENLPAELAENLAANLPADFLKYLAESAGDELVPRIAEAIASNPVTAIRLNPFKTKKLLEAGYSIEDILQMIDAEDGGYESIPWCADGFYLNRRPSFTHDPLFHAGLYYVQEPSSMFLSVLQPIIDSLLRSVKRLNVLDLCASPGGKTTHLCSMLGSKENLPNADSLAHASQLPNAERFVHASKLPNSDRSLLICNEVIRSRTGALAENMVKWGRHTNVMVTSDDASKFSALDGFFHMILVDAPCSGEGMFRKDRDSVNEWSVNNVALCASRQQRIVSDVWSSLAEGGYLAYSTCTFNRYENDDNVRWICEELGAKVVDLSEFMKSELEFMKSELESMKSELESLSGILKSKAGGYHFFPGVTKGEGFYFALLQKKSSDVQEQTTFREPSKNVLAALKRIYSIDCFAKGEQKGKDFVPSAEYALSLDYEGVYPSIEVDRQTALLFLARENFILPDAPKGFLRITYKGLGLGFVKNLGNRLNNLHPVNRRIRNLNR
ncbi:Ribosomal RNA small subunit methyltransferase F [bioreactor metagenome]|uniref:Ribosomal RNA small subunit methyltransferase F n=1 Tax=bioreactor metagenome TaxID=1076179 RepID=A0A645A339_9ZZZZ